MSVVSWDTALWQGRLYSLVLLIYELNDNDSDQMDCQGNDSVDSLAKVFVTKEV